MSSSASSAARHEGEADQALTEERDARSEPEPEAPHDTLWDWGAVKPTQAPAPVPVTPAARPAAATAPALSLVSPAPSPMAPARPLPAVPAATAPVEESLYVRRTAALKVRWRTLRQELPEPERTAVLLAPGLFSCSVEFPGLKADTPGVAGVRPHRRFGHLAARLKLPAPGPVQSARRLVSALLLLPQDGGARVLVQPADTLSTLLLSRLAERCAAANAFYEKAKVPVRFELLRPGTLDASALARLDALGGCLYGRPAPWLIEQMAKVEVTEAMRFSWVPHCPTGYGRVQLLLGQKPVLKAPRTEPFGEQQALSRALIRALKQKPLAARPDFRAYLKRELLPGRLVACLLPQLQAALPQVPKKKTPLLVAGKHGRQVELRLETGEPFALGPSLLQARVRAVLLAHALWGHVPEAWLTGPQWRKLAQKLSSERAKSTLLVALGPEGTALALRLKAGCEPRMRELDADQTVKRVVSAAAAQDAVEVVPCAQAQQLEAAHLSQLAWRAQVNLGAPLAVEHQGGVLYFKDGRFRRYSAKAFFVRPRKAVLLAELPRKDASALGATVTCEAKSEPGGALLTWSKEGALFRERVSLEVLATHLQGALRICAQSPEKSKLVLHLDDALERHLKAGRTQTLPSTGVELKGRLPRDLQVAVGEQIFAFSQHRAAAETVLSAWPLGVRGFLDVKSCDVGVPASPKTDALMRLYARSLATRRLFAHIARLTRP